MKKHLLFITLLGLFFRSIYPVAELPLKSTSTPELRFEYAMAKLGCKTFELQELKQSLSHNPYLDLDTKQKVKIDQLRQLFYGKRSFHMVIAAYNHSIDAGVLAAKALIMSCAQELDITLSNSLSDNPSIDESIVWIEDSVKKIIKKYHSFAPRAKSSIVESIGRLLLLNNVSQFILAEGEVAKGHIAAGIFGALTHHVLSQSSESDSTNASIKAGGITLAAYLGSMYGFRYLQGYSQKLAKKDERLAAYKTREKAIKEQAYFGLFDYVPGKKGLSNIIGIQNPSILKTVSFYVDWLKKPIRYSGKDNGRKAIVLYGEPGNGKGTITKAIADEAQTPIISITSSDLASDGLAEKLAIAEIHAARSKNKAMIVLFDEIDLSTGDFTGKKANEVAMQKLLTTLDGVQSNNPHTRILFVFATNYINKLDPRMLRPGRIQHKIYVGPPNHEQRKALFTQFLANLVELPEDALTTLADASEQFSRVAIEDVVTSVIQQAIFEEHAVTLEDFLKEIETKKHSVFHSSNQLA